MSYAGTYGPSETCIHDSYIRNCWRCNGDVERFRREYPRRMEHPKLAESITVSSRVITVYDAECPSPLCGWRRYGETSREKLDADLEAHIADCRRVAAEWSRASDIKHAAGIV